jgi:hypothetical protein
LSVVDGQTGEGSRPVAKAVVDQAAVLICPLVKFPYCWLAQMSRAVSEFLEVFRTHLWFALVGTPGHGAT